MGNLLKGGKADNMSLTDIAKKHDPKGYNNSDNMLDSLKKQVKIGLKFEMDHTDNQKIAKEIVYDHLYEDPTYYTKLKKVETKEQTMGDSSGSFEAPAFGKTILKKDIHKIHNTKEQEIDEVTDGSSSGAYDVPFGSGSKTPLKIGGVKSIMSCRAVRDKKFPKWGGPGGTFVKIKEKCKKFPYCNQGDIKALEFFESKELNEAVRSTAKKTGLSYDEVEKIVLKEINELFISK